jgi:hypothetical protein
LIVGAVDEKPRPSEVPSSIFFFVCSLKRAIKVNLLINTIVLDRDES